MAKNNHNKRLNKKNETRRQIKKKAVEFKGGKCEICGYDRCLAALTFHHLDPSKKNFGISDKGHEYGWEAVQKELLQTLMLCSNCHTEHHEGLLNLDKFTKPNTPDKK